MQASKHSLRFFSEYSKVQATKYKLKQARFKLKVNKFLHTDAPQNFEKWMNCRGIL